jgi:hypothetical protein
MDDPSSDKRESVRPKRKRRWLQFSLRSLLMLMVVCAFASAWLTRKVAQKRAEREAAEALAKAGASVMYDYQRGPAPPTAPGPKWLQNVLGADLFNSVEQVHFIGRDKLLAGTRGNVTDDDLRNLPALPDLKTLGFTLTPKITDAGLANLKGLSGLRWLAIGGTGIGDAGLANIKGLSRLESLFLGGNQITDAGLTDLQGLAQLHELSLGEDHVTDDGLINIEPLKQLKYLTLRNQKFTDAALKHVSNLHELLMLNLREDHIGDAGMEYIRDLRKLTRLYLYKTDVSDEGIANFEGLTELTELDLTMTDVSDAGLVHLKKLAKLRKLTLDATLVTDAGIADLQGALPNCQISGWHSDRAMPTKTADRKAR